MFGVNNLSVSGMLAKLRAYRNTSTKPAPQKTPDQVAKEKQAIEDRRSFLRGAASWGTAGFLTLYTPLPMVNKAFADDTKISKKTTKKTDKTKSKPAADAKLAKELINKLDKRLKGHKADPKNPKYFTEEFEISHMMLKLDTSKFPKKLQNRLKKEFQRHINFITKVIKAKQTAVMKQAAKDRPNMFLEDMRIWNIVTSTTKKEQVALGIDKDIDKALLDILKTAYLHRFKAPTKIAWKLISMVDRQNVLHQEILAKVKKLKLEKDADAQKFVLESKRRVDIFKNALKALKLAHGLDVKENKSEASKAKAKAVSDLATAKANIGIGVNSTLAYTKHEQYTLDQAMESINTKLKPAKPSKLNSKSD